MLTRTLVGLLLLTLSTADAGCLERLSRYARHYSLAHSKGVVATHRWGDLLFLFGNSETPDQVVLLGRNKDYTLYTGRVLRIPVREKLRLRDVQEPIFPPTYLLPRGRVPHAVQDRVTAYYDYIFSDSWEPLTHITTEDGVLILSKTYRGYVAQEYELYPTEKHKFTVFMVPSQLRTVAGGILRHLGDYRRHSGDPLDLRPKYYSPYVMISLVEGRGIGLPIYSSDLPNILLQMRYREEASEYLDFGPWSRPVWPESTSQSETWIMKAEKPGQNLAADAEDFVLHKYGVVAVKVADENLADFQTSIIGSGKITLLPQVFEVDEIPLGNIVVDGPVVLDISALSD